METLAFYGPRIRWIPPHFYLVYIFRKYLFISRWSIFVPFRSGPNRKRQSSGFVRVVHFQSLIKETSQCVAGVFLCMFQHHRNFFGFFPLSLPSFSRLEKKNVWSSNLMAGSMFWFSHCWSHPSSVGCCCCIHRADNGHRERVKMCVRAVRLSIIQQCAAAAAHSRRGLPTLRVNSNSNPRKTLPNSGDGQDRRDGFM